MGNRALIEELERQFGDNPQRVFARLASEYRKAGELAQAIELCRTYVPQQPGYISGHIVLGQALFESGQLDEAQRTFETALQLDPENLIALRQLGDIAHARGDLAGARGWYTRLLDVDPQNEEVVAQLAALDTAPAPAPSGAALATPAAAAAANAEAAAPAPTAASPEATLDGIAVQLEGAATAGAEAPGEHAHRAGADSGAKQHTPSDADLAGLWESETDAGEAAEPGTPPAARGEPESPQPSLGLESFVAMLGETTMSDGVAEHEPLDTPLEGLTSAEESAFIDLGAPAPRDSAEREQSRPFSPVADFSLPPLETESMELDRGSPGSRPAQARSSEAPAETERWSPFESTASETPSDTAYAWEAETPAGETEAAGVGESPAAAAAREADAVPDQPSAPWSPFGDEEPADAVPRRAGASDAPDAGRQSDPPDAFVTETMAELYVQQGLLRQAVDVYRQLVEMRPAEDALRARLAELQEELALANSATDRRTDAEERFGVGVTAVDASPAEPSAFGDDRFEVPAASEADARGGDVPDSVAPERSVEPAIEPPGESRIVPPAAPSPRPAARGQSVRAFFSALGGRRSERVTPQESVAAGPQGGAARSHGDAANGRSPAAPVEVPPEPDPSESEMPSAEATTGASGSALPFLDLPGEPSRAAPSSLSLDDVFRETMGRPQRSTTDAESLDEFFSESEEAEREGDAAQGGGPPPTAAADLEAFNAWLEGLKK